MDRIEACEQRLLVLHLGPGHEELSTMDPGASGSPPDRPVRIRTGARRTTWRGLRRNRARTGGADGAG